MRNQTFLSLTYLTTEAAQLLSPSPLLGSLLWTGQIFLSEENYCTSDFIQHDFCQMGPVRQP